MAGAPADDLAIPPLLRQRIDGARGQRVERRRIPGDRRAEQRRARSVGNRLPAQPSSALRAALSCDSNAT
jgi:hypothetical protein